MKTLIALSLLTLAASAQAEDLQLHIDSVEPSLSNVFEAMFILCRDASSSDCDCWSAPGSQLLLRATLIPEHAKRGTAQMGIRRPDRFWLVEIAPNVSRAAILKRMDDLGCGIGDEHFIHAIERQFIGAKIAHAPVEFRLLN